MDIDINRWKQTERHGTLSKYIDIDGKRWKWISIDGNRWQ